MCFRIGNRFRLEDFGQIFVRSQLVLNPAWYKERVWMIENQISFATHTFR
jgi:hypothetical protein